MVLRSTGFAVTDASGNLVTVWRMCIYDMFPSQYSSIVNLWPMYRIKHVRWQFNSNTPGLAKGDLAVEVIHGTTTDITPSTTITQMGREPSSVNGNTSFDTVVHYRPIYPKERDFFPSSTTSTAPAYINLRVEGALPTITIGNVVIDALVEFAHAM
jgi:hypothetical protein